ncbi:hypothetical protein MUK42_28369 [Musa troglodytarum]|uniref:Uncharacterized protein n=1 Tax=Musa troglodytarum TaxID=320322 RepID=A0A9E7G273_9LILI|nr:hypothetical protein MUK42_28369 [Musa troglodytarum]
MNLPEEPCQQLCTVIPRSGTLRRGLGIVAVWFGPDVEGSRGRVWDSERSKRVTPAAAACLRSCTKVGSGRTPPDPSDAQVSRGGR